MAKVSEQVAVNSAVAREKPTRTRGGVTGKVTLYESEAAPGVAADAIDFYVTLNRFPDGRPCEVFVKATGGYQGWCDALARLVSVMLQHGITVETIGQQLAHAHFAPFGMVPEFGFARSFPDYLARAVLGERGTQDPAFALRGYGGQAD